MNFVKFPCNIFGCKLVFLCEIEDSVEISLHFPAPNETAYLIVIPRLLVD